MSISIHQASAPVFIQGLKGLKGVLTKAAAHVEVGDGDAVGFHLFHQVEQAVQLGGGVQHRRQARGFGRQQGARGLALALGGFTMGLIVAGLTLLVPPALVNFLASKRSKKFSAALPDTLNLLSGSLRAGYSLLQGVEAVSKEVGDPMGQELRRVITEARLGREIEDAMDAVAERMDSPDFAWAVMAIRIQREVGGNLSELLLTVADTMVHRERLRRDIAALTAEGKISAIILGLLPVGLGAFMWMSNPVYMKPLGATTMGHVLLAVALVSLLIGFAWMKKIINIKI